MNRWEHFPRRVIQYLIGIICMAIGLVMLKRTCWGVSPITAVPDAFTHVFPLTLGNATILLHLVCVIGAVIVQRRITLKNILAMCIGVPFGYLVDLFMSLWNPTLLVWQKIIVLIIGIAIQGLGVALISSCDLMLPAPDELTNVISRTYGKKLGSVKMVSDAIYVVISIIVNLLSIHSLSSFGISSVASVFLTGWFVNQYRRLFPKMIMPPFFTPPKAKEPIEASENQ